jgi:deazaflavin-dependent oxidoreductase (nitroreductase family)
MDMYRSLLVRAGHTRLGSWLVSHVLTRIDRRLYRWSGGRVLVTGPVVFPTLLLTTTGRRSGRPRTVPVLYLRDGERIVIGTGNTAPGGAQWPRNLSAHPEACVQVGRATLSCRARPATADEMAHYWPALVALYPPYASYERRSGVAAKVFVLEPLAGDG